MNQINEKELDLLFAKYKEGKCSANELECFFTYIKNPENEPIIRRLLSANWELKDEIVLGIDSEKAFHATDEKIHLLWKQEERFSTHKLYLKWASIAAVFVMLLGAALLVWNNKETTISSTKNLLTNKQYQNQLTLPNGSQLSLETEIKEPKTLFEKAGIRLVQLESDLVEIQAPKSIPNNPVWLELLVSKARRMRVKFDDGSLVWVNANSTLRFSFGGNHRNAELNGEGYFEITPNHKKPFTVTTPDQVIQVYGTKFNVRNYPDEEYMITSLIEGKVSVKKRLGNEKATLLSPGKQIILSREPTKDELTEINNTNEVLGWTTGKRYYNNTALKTILKDLSRQYDIVLDWDKVPSLRFQGAISEEYNLDEILTLLNQTADIKIKRNNNHLTFEQ